MADAALSFAIENVGNFLIQKGKFLSGVRDEVEELQIELEWMQCFLKDAERRKGESHRVRNWVAEIRKATYDVEDVVERFVLKSALRNRKGVMNRIKKYVFFINRIVELHQVGSRIEVIKSKLSKLRTRLKIYGIKELSMGGEEAAATGSRRKRQDYAHVDAPNVVGLDGKIKDLVKRLIDAKGGSVVSIYGMGGLGKTTAAKKVYNDSGIREHFKCFAWVYVSRQFNQRQVWESILIQISNKKKEEIEKMTKDELTSQLCSIQKERKCLLVIDDIWSSQDWDNLSPAFPSFDEGSRSKILLTSRTQSVATNEVYSTSLTILGPTNSMQLLKNTILFLGGSNHLLNEMLSEDKSVREMVKQCAGLPLSIVVLGGILATKHELAEWERVGDNIKLVLKRGEQEGTQGVNSVLESSYENLPYNLKSCFLYFSQYREDEEIKVTKLIQRWIGEGFIPFSIEGDETMEDVAERYLNEMVRRCMIQVGEKGQTGRIKTCRMHDMMREFCISKAKEEGFAHTIDLRVENVGTILEKVSIRRLCIFSGESGYKHGRSMLSSIGEISPQLRSILFHDFDGMIGDDQVIAGRLIIKKLKLVRVLEFPNNASWYGQGLKHIGNLVHLRLLKLGCGIPKLPSSIGNLMYLQTLNLELCSPSLKIPDSVWGMEQLRHLYLPWNGGGVCESSKPQLSNLGNLQTLVNFPPEKFDLQQNLVKLTSVRKLVINYRWEAKDKISRSPEIVFNWLQSLSFEYNDNDSCVDLEDITGGCPRLYRLFVRRPIRFPETVTETIWPSNLTKLVLRSSLMDKRYMRMLAKLQNLKILFLEYNAFIEKEMIFDKNDFPQLHHLLVDGLFNLETWSVYEGALPSLFCLEIIQCRRLKSVPDGSQYLKKLKELKVIDMAYSFRKRLEQGGEDRDIVSHVPSISFSYIVDPDPESLEKTCDGIEAEQ